MSSDLSPLPAPASPAPARKGVVLLVDDEPSVLSALRRLLHREGYQIRLASSGAEGLEQLKQGDVDLVISDMRMPEMDGAQFLKRAVGLYPDIARILLTGYADIGATISAINEGRISRYITKPWVDEDLVQCVRDALELKALKHSNAVLLALTQQQNQALQEANESLEARVKARTAELEQVNGMLDMAYQEVSNTFTLAVNVLSGMLEMRRDGIAGHSRKVAALAVLMGRRLKLDEKSLQDLNLAGLLHDIGKIGFPDAMLGKPVSAYSPEEAARYRRHPLDGELALMPLAALHGVAKIIRQHHERIDGRGFPDGLQGAEVLLAAQVIAAASDYEGMVAGELAQKAYTQREALQAIKGGGGSRYEHRVVEALLAAVEDQAAEAALDVAVEARELKPGMVLAYDLVSDRGIILLAAGYRFDERIIKQVCDFAQREGRRLVVPIRLDSIKPGMLNE
ncbi:MAG: two-component system response regulator [Ideonella sp. MAG2]|nr:MAG: two-component system response regulator [Ideonella sp. MAG2]